MICSLTREIYDFATGFLHPKFGDHAPMGVGKNKKKRLIAAIT
jgi:hypothetical protein